MIRPATIVGGPLLFSVLLSASIATTTTLSVTPNAPIVGQTITLTAMVSPATATGFVSFVDQGVLVGSAKVNAGGVAQMTTLSLPAGSHSLVAVYGGGTGYLSSESSTLPYKVTAVAGIGFAAAVNYPAGNAPYSVVVADFNRDGRADLAVTSYTDTLGILLGNGDGTFQPAVSYTTGTFPTTVASGDFNGDGKVDLVVANQNSNNVSVLLGNGEGTFGAATNYPAGGGPAVIAVVDLDGDGIADLAVGNVLTNNLSVLLGNGDGTFQVAISYYFGIGGPGSIAPGDFNGDGKADLAITGYGGKLAVLLGNGNGTFQAPVIYSVDTGSMWVIVGEFNGDGKQDLAMADFSNNCVDVLLGNGDGTFQTAVSYAAGKYPQSVTMGDFNGDGKLDLAVADTGVNTVNVLLGNGDGTFQTAVHHAVGQYAIFVTAGDFNGDGVEDLVVANNADDTVSVLLGFQPAPPPTGAPTTTSLTSSSDPSIYGKPVTLTATVVPSSASGSVEFLDGSSVLGVGTFVAGEAQLATSLLPSGANSLRAIYTGVPTVWLPSESSALNQAVNTVATAGFLPRASYATGPFSQSVTVGDFNGDGEADLAVTKYYGGVSVLLGNGNGTFQPEVNYAAGTTPYLAAVGDVNGDGKPDLVVANHDSNNVSVLLGNGDGTFQTAVNYFAGTGPASVAIGDFNGDGKADLAAADSGSTIVSVLTGNGDGTFQTAATYDAAISPQFVVVGDFNGDGKADLAVANSYSGNVSVLLGNGDGTFPEPVNYVAGAGTCSEAVADFNGDGKLDLAVANCNQNVSVLLGNGDGTFAPAANYAAGTFPVSVAVVDFNGDEKPDLVTANNGSNTVSVLLGKGNGTFQPAVNYAAGSGPTFVAVGDFNRDGAADLAVANSDYIGGVSVLLGAIASALSPVSVTPASGSGATQTFNFTFQDPAGYADLKILDVLTSTFLDGEVACYLAFLPSSASAGTVYLVDDAGDAGGPFAGALLINGSTGGTINNSQCTINASGSSVSASGNSLTLNLAMSFAPGWAGNKAFYMAARTATQNSGWQALGTWDVPGAPPAGPEVGVTTPARSVSMGQSYMFTFTDTAGYTDLFVLDVLTGSFLDGTGACYFAYVPTSASNGYLYLVDDAGDGGYAPGSPIALSSGGTLQNSQCTLNTAGSSALGSGNTLTLTLPIAFKPAFAGNQVFFEAARNNSTGNSGWQAAGSVTVP